MIIHDDIDQMSDQWFDLKNGVPSASGASKVVTPKTGALSASAGPYMDYLVEQLLGLENEDEKWSSDDMDSGVETEPRARELFQMETGMEIRQVAWITNDDGTAGCSPDGIIELPGAKMGWEAKCPLPRTHLGYRRVAEPFLLPDFTRFELYDARALPPKYKPQVHWSMAITGYQRWYFQSYHDSIDPLYVLVEADAYTVKVRAAINEFTAMLAHQKVRYGLDTQEKKAA